MNLYSYSDLDAMTNKEIRRIYRKNISKNQSKLFSRFQFGRDLVRYAQGSYIYLKNGRKILDATGGIGVLNHGHNHPRIIKVRKDFQNKKRMEVHKAYHSQYLAALSHNIAQLLPGDLNYSYFPNSGAEAIEAAIKMAYKYHEGERNTILHSNISFHGKLIGSGSITGSSEVHFNFPKMKGTKSFDFGSIKSVKHEIEKATLNGKCDVYAIVVEPYSVSTMQDSSEEFLYEIQKICNKLDIVLIFDEIYSGWGKMGSLFYFMRYPNLLPDILCYAKSFGGGKASISGITARDSIFNSAYDNPRDATLQSSTYYGFGEETVTALEAINVIHEDDYVGKSKFIEHLIKLQLRDLLEEFPEKISGYSGAGALWGISFKEIFFESSSKKHLNFLPINETFFWQKISLGALLDYIYREKNVLLFASFNQKPLLKISLPLIASKKEVDKIADALRSALSQNQNDLVKKFIYKNIGSRSK